MLLRIALHAPIRDEIRHHQQQIGDIKISWNRHLGDDAKHQHGQITAQIKPFFFVFTDHAPADLIITHCEDEPQCPGDQIHAEIDEEAFHDQIFEKEQDDADTEDQPDAGDRKFFIILLQQLALRLPVSRSMFHFAQPVAEIPFRTDDERRLLFLGHSLTELIERGIGDESISSSLMPL